MSCRKESIKECLGDWDGKNTDDLVQMIESAMDACDEMNSYQHSGDSDSKKLSEATASLSKSENDHTSDKWEATSIIDSLAGYLRSNDLHLSIDMDRRIRDFKRVQRFKR